MTLAIKKLNEMTLKEFRMYNLLDRDEFAAKCEGISYLHYSKIERGAKEPSIAIIKKIANVMNQPPELIFKMYLNSEKEAENAKKCD